MLRVGKPTWIALVALLALAPFGVAQAADGYEPGTTHPTLDVGAAFGGDKLATDNTLFDGNETVYAGKSLYADVGVQHNFVDSAWSLKATAGVQRGFPPAHPSNPTFTRYPLDLLLLYNQEHWHLGFGATYHANPKLMQNDDGPDVAFHDAVGGVLQVQYRIFGFRYTNIRYRSADACPGRCSYDGSTLGLYLDFVF